MLRCEIMPTKARVVSGGVKVYTLRCFPHSSSVESVLCEAALVAERRPDKASRRNTVITKSLPDGMVGRCCIDGCWPQGSDSPGHTGYPGLCS